MIEQQMAFKRDFKREKMSDKHKNFDGMIKDILSILLADAPIPPRYKDHALTGNWIHFRECHIKPDLLLIYQKKPNSLLLVRLGSHSEIFD